VTQKLQVVIAGAGPSGLMCALALAAQEVPVVVCEAEPSLTHDLRAGTFHPPTQEMMAPYGITARMHEHGLKVQRWQIRSRQGGQVAEFEATRFKPSELRLEAFHPQGTARIAKPGEGVCASDGSVHGVAGLHVADASLFPAAVGVNPMMTIVAFAKRVAAEVAEATPAA